MFKFCVFYFKINERRAAGRHVGKMTHSTHSAVLVKPARSNGLMGEVEKLMDMWVHVTGVHE